MASSHGTALPHHHGRRRLGVSGRVFTPGSGLLVTAVSGPVDVAPLVSVVWRDEGSSPGLSSSVISAPLHLVNGGTVVVIQTDLDGRSGVVLVNHVTNAGSLTTSGRTGSVSASGGGVGNQPHLAILLAFVETRSGVLEPRSSSSTAF